MAISVSNRRRYERTPLSMPVRFNEIFLEDEFDLSDELDPDFIGRTINISAGGALIESPTLFPHNSLLAMHIMLPGNKQTNISTDTPHSTSNNLTVIARVVRSGASMHDNTFAVKFINLDFSEILLINEFAATHRHALH